MSDTDVRSLGSVRRFCSRRISSQNPSVMRFLHGQFVHQFSAFHSIPKPCITLLRPMLYTLHEIFKSSWFSRFSCPKAASCGLHPLRNINNRTPRFVPLAHLRQLFHHGHRVPNSHNIGSCIHNTAFIRTERIIAVLFPYRQMTLAASGL